MAHSSKRFCPRSLKAKHLCPCTSHHGVASTQPGQGDVGSKWHRVGVGIKCSGMFFYLGGCWEGPCRDLLAGSLEFNVSGSKKESGSEERGSPQLYRVHKPSIKGAPTVGSVL